MRIQACIFDLDGVIVDTARFHFVAWRRMANALGFDFDEARNERLKGVSRVGSMKLILQWGGISLSHAEREMWMQQKNEWYLEQVRGMGPQDILEGALEFLEAAKSSGLQVALGSASKNAQLVLKQVGLADFFSTVVDGTQTTRSKPDPQVFQLGAERMNCATDEVVVFEDAFKGIEAAKNGNFMAVGIGEPEVLTNADLVWPNFIDRTIQELENAFAAS
ncbi:MAG: beta-phosphoglucomutase [Phaeodactylibacter sp.]|nr:beta-phosphoglucomutase [Phaeodactylibacter sp.]